MTQNLMSEQVNEILCALAKAQGKIQPATKDKSNPYFKSKYADLKSVWNACRDALSENGISVIQKTQSSSTGVVLVTLLGHASGQWIQGEMPLTFAKSDPQTIGSTITYFRRYCLAAMVGVAPDDDDDGEKAQAPYRDTSFPKKEKEKKIGISKQQVQELQTVLDRCDPSYTEWFYRSFKKKYSTEDLADLPFEFYQATKDAASKNAEEFSYSLTLQEAQ